jgi:outer membrane protein assembly factor BamB
MTTRCCFLLAFLACCRGAPAEDWPQFGGPAGKGISPEKGIPVSWSAKKNVAWKFRMPGSGWSSPVVVEEKVYLSAAVVGRKSSKDAPSLVALAVDGGSGKLLWQTELFAKARSSRRHSKNSHASPTPLVDDGRLYVHFGTNGTACLDLDGKVLWKNEKLVYNPVHGGGSSPVRSGEVIVFSCDGSADPFVVGLDRKSGKIRWRTKRPESSGKLFAFATALSLDLAGKKQVILPGANWIAGYDPADGSELWRAWHGGYSVVPRPLYGHGLVYFSSSFDQAKLFAIRPDGKGEVTKTHIAWQSSRSAPHSPTPVLVGEELYCVSDRGIASCIEARTGKLHWRERVGGNYSASVLYADGRVYFQSEKGEGVVIEAGKKFKVLSRNKLGERTLASYAISSGAIYIRGADHLFKIQASPEGKEP